MGVAHTSRPARCMLLEAGSSLSGHVPLDDLPVIGAPGPRYRVHGELLLPETSLVAALVAREHSAEHSLALVAEDDRGSAALCLATPARFETQCLGVPTARLTRMLGWGPNAEAMLGKAIESALAALAQRGTTLVLAACDGDDQAAALSLTSSGFVSTGTRLTYVYRRDPAARPALPRITYRVRPARASDAGQVARLAGTVRGGQFHRIPGLDASRIERLYGEWARKALAGEFADGVLVAVRDDDPVAFLSWKALEDVALATGRHVAGRGLGAADAHASGAYVSVAATALIAVSYEGEFEGGEFDIDSTNLAVTRIVERFGLTLAHGTRTFYRALQPAADERA